MTAIAGNGSFYAKKENSKELLTQGQLELFELIPRDFKEIEAVIKQLPTMRQRERFRKLFVKKWHEIPHDGTIMSDCGARQTKESLKWLKETLENTLVKTLEHYKINMEFLMGFAHKTPEWLREVYEEVRNSKTCDDVDMWQVNHNYKEYISKEKAQSRIPFYLIGEMKLKKLASQVASAFSRSHIEYINMFKDLGLTPMTEKEINRRLLILYKHCGKVCEEIGFPLPHWKNNKQAKKLKPSQIDTALCKVACEKYWFHVMRKTQRQMVEHIAIVCGEVRKGVSMYISENGLNQFVNQIKSNHAFLKRMIIENVDDPSEQAELFDMYIRSSSNPDNLRLEMMTRLRGIEEWADEKNNIALFVTLTAPSSFHAKHSDGRDNKKYSGCSPKQTQEYLNSVWRKARALFKKRNISFYGMRVAEPHHDGTPHWHLLMYINEKHKDEVCEILKSKALEVDGYEAGAKEHRCKIELCDKSIGTATGYICKYISKNINGFAGSDEVSDEGEEISFKENAKRARAWASLWGIRQFQFYGDKFVSLWREMRRLASQKIKTDNNQCLLDFDGEPQVQEKTTKNYPSAWNLSDNQLSRAVACADVGDYAAFVDCMVQDGFLAPRKDMPIRLHYEQSEPNKYQEVRKIVKGLKCVFTSLDPVITRLKKWAIRKGDPNRHNKIERSEAKNSGHRPPWTCVDNCNLKNNAEIVEKIKNAVRPHAKPLKEHHINHLLKGNTVVINEKLSIKLIDNEAVLFENDYIQPAIPIVEGSMLSRIWKLFN